MADILFGKANPCGKLPFVIPENEADLPYVDWHAKEQHYQEMVGYRYLYANGKKPLFPFGFGLSYTKFALQDKKIEKKDDTILIKTSLQNTGKKSGSEVVQAYAAFENEVRKLCGFKKVYLQAGEKKEVELQIPMQQLESYDCKTKEMTLRKGCYHIFVGTDSNAVETGTVLVSDYS